MRAGGGGTERAEAAPAQQGLAASHLAASHLAASHRILLHQPRAGLLPLAGQGGWTHDGRHCTTRHGANGRKRTYRRGARGGGETVTTGAVRAVHVCATWPGVMGTAEGRGRGRGGSGSQVDDACRRWTRCCHVAAALVPRCPRVGWPTGRGHTRARSQTPWAACGVESCVSMSHANTRRRAWPLPQA